MAFRSATPLSRSFVILSEAKDLLFCRLGQIVGPLLCKFLPRAL
jgi:hypothetical protein